MPRRAVAPGCAIGSVHAGRVMGPLVPASLPWMSPPISVSVAPGRLLAAPKLRRNFGRVSHIAPGGGAEEDLGQGQGAGIIAAPRRAACPPPISRWVRLTVTSGETWKSRDRPSALIAAAASSQVTLHLIPGSPGSERPISGRPAERPPRWPGHRPTPWPHTTSSTGGRCPPRRCRCPGRRPTCRRSRPPRTSAAPARPAVSDQACRPRIARARRG